MSNTSADKFAEYPYYSCEIKPHNDNFGLGRGQWYNNSGKGILDNKDGSGFAKGYTSYADNSPNHYRFDVKIKQ